MKNLKHISKILLLIVLSACIASCSKESGPQGEKGSQGEKGIQGLDGATVLSGTTAPGVSTGDNGDFYLNLTTSMFYGPKTAAGWGNGFSMKGATGETGSKGAAGSKILSGTGTPDASLGAAGDYYLDKNSSSLYGPKLSSGWGTALALKGAKGATGDTGPTGATGTANVLYSGWNYATNFNDTTIDNSSLRIGHLKAPALTTTILNSGTVHVYFTYGGGVLPLPYTSNAGGKPNTISFIPRLKDIIVTRFTDDNSNSVALSTLLQYRYVIIPGGLAAPTATKKPNLNNYNEVKMFYNIPD